MECVRYAIPVIFRRKFPVVPEDDGWGIALVRGRLGSLDAGGESNDIITAVFAAVSVVGRQLLRTLRSEGLCWLVPGQGKLRWRNSQHW